VPPFGFFKKKEGDTDQTEQSRTAIAQAGTISILQAHDLLRNLESTRVKELATRLGPIKESASKSLRTIAQLADDLEHEKIKLEDLEQRHKSVVENSRKTVVSSLRREASTEFQLPKTMNDAKKFKERFETMMNRIGEVTGSHSKMLSIFMKKYAGKLRNEFGSLSKLLNEVKAAMSDLEQNRAPIVKCGNILNTASQKVTSIRSTESSIQGIEDTIKNIETDLIYLKRDLEALKNSSEFGHALEIVQKIEDIEKKEAQLRMQMIDLFSHVSRAFTKYSYNITKETEARLLVLSEEPWKILYEHDLSPYSSLLIEIYRSISAGQIQLKDSDKVLNYMDAILKLLPELQSKALNLRKETGSLLQGDSKLVYRAKDIQGKIIQHEDELARNRQLLEQQMRQVAEKKAEVDALLNEASDILAELTGQKYLLAYQLDN
jgi:DNA repair exonuclease SbcCD ATPase subunit